MKSIHFGRGFVALLVALGLSAGCASERSAPKSGGDAAPAPGVPATTAAPQEEAEAEPTTLADAEALLDKARHDLDRLALNEPAPAPPAARAAAPSAPRATSMPTPAPELDQSRRADESAAGVAAAPAKEVSPCETACKAFSSLTRASDAVCRLDTEGGKRCERARQIRQDASHRVASCGCAK